MKLYITTKKKPSHHKLNNKLLHVRWWYTTESKALKHTHNKNDSFCCRSQNKFLPSIPHVKIKSNPSFLHKPVTYLQILKTKKWLRLREGILHIQKIECRCDLTRSLYAKNYKKKQKSSHSQCSTKYKSLQYIWFSSQQLSPRSTQIKSRTWNKKHSKVIKQKALPTNYL